MSLKNLEHLTQNLGQLSVTPQHATTLTQWLHTNFDDLKSELLDYVQQCNEVGPLCGCRRITVNQQPYMVTDAHTVADLKQSVGNHHNVNATHVIIQQGSRRLNDAELLCDCDEVDAYLTPYPIPVTTPGGKVVTLIVTVETTGLQAKERLRTLENIPIDRQELLVNGRPLLDHDLIYNTWTNGGRGPVHLRLK